MSLSYFRLKNRIHKAEQKKAEKLAKIQQKQKAKQNNKSIQPPSKQSKPGQKRKLDSDDDDDDEDDDEDASGMFYAISDRA